MQPYRLLLAAILASLIAHGAHAAATPLYHNVSDPLPSFQGAAIGFAHSHEKSAQPFTTGDLGIISSVGIPLAGETTGIIHVEIWNEVEGMPGEKIAEVGDIDIAPVQGFPVGELITIHNFITGLEPHTTYFLVLNNSDVFISCSGGPGPGCNTYLILTAPSNIRTNESGRLLIQEDGVWAPFPDRNYQILQIYECAPPDPLQLEIKPATAISWDSNADKIYEIHSSPDLENWTVAVEAIQGTGEKLTRCFIREKTQLFYRVEERR